MLKETPRSHTQRRSWTVAIESSAGNRFLVTFVDDYSRYCIVAPMKEKSEVFDKFKQFKAQVENELGRKIRSIRTDNGGEYCSAKFEDFLRRSGIRHQKTVPYSPQQNGVAERKNGLIQEMGIAMMSIACAPRMFWAEASVTAVYLQNRMVTNSKGVTPFERWKGWKPSVRHLRIFGCKAYALKPDREKSKFSGKADQCIFLRYEENVKGYRLLEPNKHKIPIRRDVKFDEANFPWKKNRD